MTVKLNRRLALESPSQLADGAGGYTRGWVQVGILWAEVVPGSGSDTPGVEISLSRVPYRITVHGAPLGSPARPRPDQRLTDGTRVFLIKAVTERDASGLYLTCFAQEEAPQ